MGKHLQSAIKPIVEIGSGTLTGDRLVFSCCYNSGDVCFYSEMFRKIIFRMVIAKQTVGKTHFFWVVIS